MGPAEAQGGAQQPAQPAGTPEVAETGWSEQREQGRGVASEAEGAETDLRRKEGLGAAGTRTLGLCPELGGCAGRGEVGVWFQAC